ncbi:MAG: hypothetical protein H7257_14360 [Taibaiella sp.]|nr:hypothetical protein [Taibaiella sp.]
MYATDFLSGNTAGCSIATNSIRILPGGTYARGNPDHVASLGPGYSFIASPVVLSTVTTWHWTDAVFQTDCAGVCFNTTGFLSNTATINCLGAGAIWATGMASYCWCNATWFPSLSVAMANTIIDLY